MTKLRDVYPLYLNNKAVQPNTDLAVTDKFTGEIAFRTALATPDVINEAIAGAVRAAEPMARLASYEKRDVLAHCVKRFAERFELYACGVELANGFGELTDAAEQRRRFEAEMDVKLATYGERYPLDEEFLDALARMPAASGVAMGFDRLVMLATGARRIADVLWTPPV